MLNKSHIQLLTDYAKTVIIISNIINLKFQKNSYSLIFKAKYDNLQLNGYEFFASSEDWQ